MLLDGECTEPAPDRVGGHGHGLTDGLLAYIAALAEVQAVHQSALEGCHAENEDARGRNRVRVVRWKTNASG